MQPTTPESLREHAIAADHARDQREFERLREQARFERIEAIGRTVILTIILLSFLGAELYLEAHGQPDGARRFDAGVGLALAGVLDSMRVSARKVRESSKARRE